jgi:hypothetical protein
VDETLIDSAETLTIEPGTNLYFYNQRKMNVKGKLIADGIEGDSISFRSYDELLEKQIISNWGGIYFNDVNAIYHFNYIKIVNAEYALNFPYDYILDKGASLFIDNSFFYKCNTISNANLDIRNSEIKYCQYINRAGNVINGGRGNISLFCNRIIFEKYISYTNVSNIIGIANVFGDGIIEDNYIDVNFSTIVFNQFYNPGITNKYLFKNNIIDNNRGTLEFATGYSDQTKSSIQEMSGNTFNGGTLDLSVYANPQLPHPTFNVYNNIFNCNLILDSINTTSTVFSIKYNLIKKLYGTEKYVGLGVEVSANANGTPIDTYYNLFQDPKFLNGRPPYLAANSPAIGAGIDSLGHPVNIGFDPTGTCLEGYFTKQPPFISGTDTLSISGQVHQGTGLLTNGLLMAINKTTNKTHITKVTNGQFKADSLDKGDYILYAVPNAGSNYLPTYYVNKVNMEDAVNVPLYGKIIGIDLYLVPAGVKETGIAYIQGRFSYADGNTDDTTSYAKNWLGVSYVPAGPIAISGHPCKTMPIKVYNSSAELISWGMTDTAGYFDLPNLKGGTYYVNGQRYGYSTENKGVVEVASNETKEVSLRMMPTSTPTGIDDTFLSNSIQTPMAYPNPFKNELSFKGSFKGNLLITDMIGRIYYQNDFLSMETISTASWPEGIYLLKAGNKVQKLMKR